MWLRFIDLLRCPACKGPLEPEPFGQVTVDIAPELFEIARRRSLVDERFNQYIDDGLLLCGPCRAMFPIVDGLPILLCYTTPLHARFIHQHSARCLEWHNKYRFLDNEPASGEKAVMDSFSTEWLGYEYDG